MSITTRKTILVIMIITMILLNATLIIMFPNELIVMVICSLGIFGVTSLIYTLKAVIKEQKNQYSIQRSRMYINKFTG